MPKYLTVVYTINNQAAFEDERKALMEKFTASKGNPWAITAMSADHELHRLGLIEEAIEQRSLDKIEEILADPDVGKYKTLDDLRGGK